MCKHDPAPVLTRECPKCKKILHYKRNYSRRRADKKNACCKSCSNAKENNPMFGKFGEAHHLYGKPNLSHRVGLTLSEETKKKISDSHKRGGYKTFLGKKHTPESLEKLREAAKKRALSEEWREKQRIGRVNFIIRNGGNRAFNAKSCKVFDILNNKFDLKGLHSLNGGEITMKGYFLDYCDKDNKICIEWDEPAHLGTKRIIRDKKKHGILSSYLGEDWIVVRWDERNKDWREGYNSPKTDKVLLDNIKSVFLEHFYKD